MHSAGAVKLSAITYDVFTLCLKKGYHPITNDNFNNSCPIPVIFGTNIAE